MNTRLNSACQGKSSQRSVSKLSPILQCQKMAQAERTMRDPFQRIDGVDELSCRLMEMGLTPGVELRVVGVAPLGDPLELELRGYRLSLRKSEAARVDVETCE